MIRTQIHEDVILNRYDVHIGAIYVERGTNTVVRALNWYVVGQSVEVQNIGKVDNLNFCTHCGTLAPNPRLISVSQLRFPVLTVVEENGKQLIEFS